MTAVEPNCARDPSVGLNMNLAAALVLNSGPANREMGLSAHHTPSLGPPPFPDSYPLCPREVEGGEQNSIFVFPTPLPHSYARNLSPRSTPPQQILTSDAHYPHLGPEKKGPKARGDLPLLFSGMKQKGP